MVTQDQHFAEQKRLKQRNKHIQEDLDYVLNPVNGDLPDEVRDRVEEAYNLGMDMGIRIGKGEI